MNINEKIKSIIKGSNFSSKDRKIRPTGCPMKRMMIGELQELTKEEIHIAFKMGLIGNSNQYGSIVENSIA